MITNGAILKVYVERSFNQYSALVSQQKYEQLNLLQCKLPCNTLDQHFKHGEK